MPRANNVDTRHSSQSSRIGKGSSASDRTIPFSTELAKTITASRGQKPWPSRLQRAASGQQMKVEQQTQTRRRTAKSNKKSNSRFAARRRAHAAVVALAVTVNIGMPIRLLMALMAATASASSSTPSSPPDPDLVNAPQCRQHGGAGRQTQPGAVQLRARDDNGRPCAPSVGSRH